MKKIIIGIIIGVFLSMGSVVLAQAKIKLIMIPDHIGGYDTIELLNYLAQLRDGDKPVIKTHPVINNSMMQIIPLKPQPLKLDKNIS